MATRSSLLGQDRGWGLFCQLSIAPLLAGTAEWLVAAGACWLVGASYAAPWTWLAHIAARYPLHSAATGLRLLSLGWAGWALLRTGTAWGEFTPYLWVLLITALAALPHRRAVWAARLALHGFVLWFVLRMEHVGGLIGLAGLLMLLI